MLGYDIDDKPAEQVLSACYFKLDREFYIEDLLRDLITSQEMNEDEAAKKKIVEQAKLSDSMHMQFGIDTLHLNLCVQHYNMADSEQIDAHRAKCQVTADRKIAEALEQATPTPVFLEDMQMAADKIPMEDRKIVNGLMTKDYMLATRKVYARFHEICCRPNITWYIAERRLTRKEGDIQSANQGDLELRKWLMDVDTILNAHIYAQLGVSQECYLNSSKYWWDNLNDPDFCQEMTLIR